MDREHISCSAGETGSNQRKTHILPADIDSRDQPTYRSASRISTTVPLPNAMSEVSYFAHWLKS